MKKIFLKKYTVLYITLYRVSHIVGSQRRGATSCQGRTRCGRSRQNGRDANQVRRRRSRHVRRWREELVVDSGAAEEGVGTTGRGRETKERGPSAVGADSGGRLAGQRAADGGHRTESGAEPTARTMAGRYRDGSNILVTKRRYYKKNTFQRVLYRTRLC